MDLLLKYRRHWKIGVAIGAVAVVFIASRLVTGDTDTFHGWIRPDRGTLVLELAESGEIEAINEEAIEAPWEWRTEMQILDMVEEGIMVNKGDFLVQFDASTLEEELETALDNLEQRRANLTAVMTEQESNMRELQNNLLIAEYSREASELSQELLKFESEIRRQEAALEYQKALLSYEETEKNIEAQKLIDAVELSRVKLSVEQSENRVSEIKERIDQFGISAPISGMVVYKEIGGRGEQRHKVAIGDKPRPGEAVISIPDLSSMKLEILVNELDVADVAIGQDVLISLDAFEDTLFTGVVDNVAKLVEKKTDSFRMFFLQNTQQQMVEVPTFAVSIVINGSDLRLKPGMTARGVIVTDHLENVVYVPLGSVFEDQEGNTVVFTRSSWPRPVQVETGARNDSFIQIVSGIDEDDSISMAASGPFYNPLGWFAEMERRRTERDTLLGHLDTMTDLGITGEEIPATPGPSGYGGTEMGPGGFPGGGPPGGFPGGGFPGGGGGRGR